MGIFSTDAAPSAPNYTGLAEQTAASSAASADKTLAQNRPNQVDQFGNTLTWSQGPDGQWTQKIAMGGQNQAGYNAQQGATQGLLGQIGSQGPLNTDNLQGVNPGAMQPGAGMGMLGGNYGPMGQLSGNYGQMGQLSGNYGPMGQVSGAGQFNMDPIGNSKAIQDATYGLLSPQRDLARNSEIQRLKSQGLTEDSPAFQRAMLRQGQADTDAQLKSLIAGTTEYGNQFGRAAGQNQQNFGQNLQQGQFNSQNQNQLFNQSLAGAQFGSQNQQQAFNQGLVGANLADSQNQQRYQQDMGRAQFGSANQAQGFNQANQQQQLALALRNQQFGERQAMHDQPLKDLSTLSGIKGYQSPEFGKFVTATDPGGVDYAGAGRDQATADIAKWNAQQAAEANKMNGVLGLAGGLLGSGTNTVGGKMVDAAGNIIGSAAGGVLDWAKNYDWGNLWGGGS